MSVSLLCTHMCSSVILVMLSIDESLGIISTSNYKKESTSSFPNCDTKPVVFEPSLMCATIWDSLKGINNFSMWILENGTLLCEKEANNIDTEGKVCTQITFMKRKTVVETSGHSHRQTNLSNKASLATEAVSKENTTSRYKAKTRYTPSQRASNQLDATPKIDRKVLQQQQNEILNGIVTQLDALLLF